MIELCICGFDGGENRGGEGADPLVCGDAPAYCPRQSIIFSFAHRACFAACRPRPAFPRRAYHHRSFAAHTQFSPGCLRGLCQRPAAGRRPIRGGRSAVPRTSTRRCAKIGGLPQTRQAPFYTAAQQKNTPITRTDDGRVLRLVQNHAGKCTDAITCEGS